MGGRLAQAIAETPKVSAWSLATGSHGAVSCSGYTVIRKVATVSVCSPAGIWALSPLVLEFCRNFQMVLQALDRANVEAVLRGADGMNPSRSSYGQTKPAQLPRGQMIGQPCLSALPFAAHGIAHDVALIRIALQLNPLLVQIFASYASRGLRIGVHPSTRKSSRGIPGTRDERYRTHASMTRRIGRTHIIVNHRVRIYNVIQCVSHGRRQLKSNDANRAPGSPCEIFSASIRSSC